ncbi:vascular non-inflammatory molecule 3-like [Aplysia californica]|uniref:Vascular non-inflammatory molecule 3-like n=1 Tax=Aplysia californica TaxID=6500 RepID=A0ABM1A0K3_APLCA|nr:vascular non-inflammatory molecule 3-like [Aplysia californica]
MLIVPSHMTHIGWGLFFLCCLVFPEDDAVFLQPAKTVGVSKSATETYRAAVYEHAVILPAITDTPVTRREALRNMQKNLDVYKLQAIAAKQLSAQILVFPENGLYGYEFTRDTIYPFLEAIPDPDTVTWSPCSEPHRFPETQVLRWLSCLAKNNSLYLVADMGDKVPCEPDIDSKCPPDKRFQYNTAVAFDPDGRLLAKYHKSNLFHEPQFNTPEPEVKYFDTPFGRFGFLICFDILFEKPAVSMVTHHAIKNIVFPTAWMDALPLLSAIGYHSSFAMGFEVNVLAANLHLPDIRVQGSGLYTPEGMKEFYYNRTAASGPKLIVADLKVLSETQNSCQTVQDHNSGKKQCLPSDTFHEDMTPDLDKNIYQNYRSDQQDTLIMPKMSTQNKSKSKTDSTQHVAEVTELFFDNVRTSGSSRRRAQPFYNRGFSFVPLDSLMPNTMACQGQVCCFLTYELTNKSSSELFVLGAFDGLFHGKYYFQTCAVLRCPKANHNTCGSYTYDSDTGFRRLELTAAVQTPLILPQVRMWLIQTSCKL